MDHRPQLDGLRAVAFLTVFVSHCPGGPPSGMAGVSCFFVLSGFLITRILEADAEHSVGVRLKRFYARRALRIFPLYYLTITWLWAAGALPDAAWHWLYLSNAKYATDQCWQPGVSHFWSLAVEEQFYLIYPPLLLATPAAGRRLLLLLGLAGSTLASAVVAAVQPGPWHMLWLPVCGDYLLWGVLAARWERAGRPLPGGSTAAVAAGLTLTLGWYALRGVAPVGPYWARVADGLPDGAGYALLILGLWRGGGLAGRLLASWPLAHLGKISYGLYVYHNPVLVGPLMSLAVALWSIGPGAHWTWPAAALAVTVGVASLSWVGFERPLLRLKARFASPLGSARTAV
jgi:peptidoglycan/LPS O-acetylase OafA/YrhL